MKKFISLLMMLMLIYPGMSIAAAVGTETETLVAYEDLPEAHRLRYEAEMASALNNARARAPGQRQLLSQVRGDFNGYTGSKTDRSLEITYRVSDSVVTVGEKVTFQADMTCDTPPMLYTVSGLVFDEQFRKTGELVGQVVHVQVDATSKTITPSYTPNAPGYFCFVLVVSDSAGNMVSLTTNTVQVYEKNRPLFSNMAVDGQLALLMNLDRAKTDLGMVLGADLEITTAADPVQYTAVWTLTDEAGSVLDRAERAGQVSAQTETAKLRLTYQPLMAGKLQLEITASDGDGNHIKTNTPVLTVADGCFCTVSLNADTALTAGSSLTAAYAIHGHLCDATEAWLRWECRAANGEVIARSTQALTECTGQATYTPRVGQEVVCTVGASCAHFPEDVAMRSLALIGGLEVERALTADAVDCGDAIGVVYSVDGGLTPYREIVVRGYACDTASGNTQTFLTRTLTEAQGTVSGSPMRGNKVYFIIDVVEADGHTTAWKTGTAALTGAPGISDSDGLCGDADGNGTVDDRDALLVMQYAADWPVKLHMESADANGNGSVDLADAVAIFAQAGGAGS
ncbi:MAG: dockerin type I repeat-containing protein [Clostridiales bacterium]|nr:dockerin type I repeat-containing protein [Clostridiales bacterium]